ERSVQATWLPALAALLAGGLLLGHLLAPAFAAGCLLRHLLALGARLRQTDGDRLLAALDLAAFAAGPALQSALVALVHRPLDILAGALGILGHSFLH